MKYPDSAYGPSMQCALLNSGVPFFISLGHPCKWSFLQWLQYTLHKFCLGLFSASNKNAVVPSIVMGSIMFIRDLLDLLFKLNSEFIWVFLPTTNS